VSAERLARV